MMCEALGIEYSHNSGNLRTINSSRSIDKMLAPIFLLFVVLILGSVDADPASSITAQDKHMLRKIYATYQPWFELENNTTFRQFSVLYYGDANVENSITPACLDQADGMVFLDHMSAWKEYSIQMCPNYIAARVPRKNDQYTEQIIFDYLKNGVHVMSQPRCPRPSTDMYLYSYNTPCPWCITKWIEYFVKACCMSERRLIIGYHNPYYEDESTLLIEKLPNVAMMRMNLHWTQARTYISDFALNYYL